MNNVVSNSKIKDICELEKYLKEIKALGKKVVLSHGVFDLLHIGHIRHLEQAKNMGDILVVILVPDRFVNRGPGQPVFTEILRAEAIASLSCVDYIAINPWPTAEETLRFLKPDIYVRGSEYKNLNLNKISSVLKEEEVAQNIGIRLAYTEDILFSSTNLINRYISNFPEEVAEYLGIFRQRYNIETIYNVLDKMSGLKVLVIGDTILDEYQYCEAIGKSSKDPVLALKYLSHDLFAGGVLAVANHVANFAHFVQLVTILGEQDSQEKFVRSQLNPNISPLFIIQDNAPTLIKRRFIEGYSLNKLFEVYIMDNSGLSEKKNKEFCQWIKSNLNNFDLIIVADFGHGAISSDVVRILEESNSFLAINTQANAGNRGFHTISKYHRADFVCIAEHEIRLEKRAPTGDLRPMMSSVANNLNCTQIVVTQGKKGALVYNKNGEFIEVPSFAQNVVDRVGAGDAFFAVTSLAAIQGVSNEILGFIGNIVGSLAVEILGNKKSIDKESTKKYIASLIR